MNIPVVVYADHANRFISDIEAQRGEVSVARHVHDISEVYGLGQTGIVRAALLVSDFQEFLSASFVAQLKDVDVAVVAVCDPGEEIEISGVHCISSLAEPDEVIQAISYAVAHIDDIPASSATHALEPEDTLSASESGTDDDRGRVITVWGSGGAPGRTTVSTNLATSLAQQGYSVVLVDADTYGPSVAISLGLIDEYSGLSQVCHLADHAELDEENYENLKSTIAVGNTYLDVLSGLTRPDRWAEIREKPLADVLTFLKARYDAVVIDTGFSVEADEELSFDGVAPRRNGATLTAIEMADAVVLIGAADVVGFPRLVRAYEELTRSHVELLPQAEVFVWLNKVRSEITGGRSEEELERAWQRFGPGQELNGFVPYARAELDKAISAGKTMIEFSPGHELSTAFEKMTQTAIGKERKPNAHQQHETSPAQSTRFSLRGTFARKKR